MRVQKSFGEHLIGFGDFNSAYKTLMNARLRAKKNNLGDQLQKIDALLAQIPK